MREIVFDTETTGLDPLSGTDVAECILFALTRPPHVSVQTLLVTPTAQASVTVSARRPKSL